MTNKIFPCLWFDGDGNEAAKFYVETFGGKITVDTPSVINFELFGQRLMILNAGPQFKKNASVSFMVFCDSEKEVEKYWSALSDGGNVLMDIGEYPWSRKYGWVEDKYGVTWQIMFTEKAIAQKIVPVLMFIHQNNGKAMDAMRFYTDLFPNSEIQSISKYGEKGGDAHEIAGNINFAQFSLNDYTFACMDNSYDHQFDFNEAVSIVVMTDDQEETDQLWNSLTSDGGRASMCGWLKDRFGLSWQIVPKKLIELMNDPDPFKGKKVMETMMTMQKIDIAQLEKAYSS